VSETKLPESIVQKVSEAVDQSSDELVGFLQELVQIPSENPKLAGIEPGGEGKVQDRVKVELETLGAEIDRWDALPGRPDMVGLIKGSGGGPSLAVNGHIDVVPVGDPEAWPHSPWSGEIADGKVWGRGALDMKGGVAAMIHAAKIIQRLGYQLKGDLLIETVVDEETGGPGTRSTVERGYRPDFAIVTEPTTLQIMPVEGGLEWVRVSVEGRSAHAANRFKQIHAGGQGTAVNALEKGAKLLSAIADLEREWGVHKVHPLVPDGMATISPGIMVAGSGGGKDGRPASLSAIATTPDYCAMEFDLKYLPHERTEDVRAEFEEYIHCVAQADPWMREHPPKVEWSIFGVSFPPADTSPDHPGVQTLASCVEQITDPARVCGFIAVSDIAWLADAGIPCTLFGPGSADSAHTTDERIEIDQLIESAKILALMMLSWCGYDEAE
jgi:acetylornithine deacetylase/succinyl-diaminopimelate desuccinylase family protein